MIINFSPLAAEAQMVADGNGVSIRVADLSLAEDKIIPFRPVTPAVTTCEYPQDLTPQAEYISATKAKPFREDSLLFMANTDGLDFSILARAIEAEDDRLERIENIIDSGLGKVPSEFFPEAA